MADVFLAHSHGLGGFLKVVVIKKLRPSLADHRDFVAMFLDEARLAAQLSHPNIVQCYEICRVDGQLGLVMEYLDGVSLDYVLARVSRAKLRLPVGMVCRLAMDMLAALQYAHDLCDIDGQPLGVVHRDIAPSNLFVTRDGIVKLLDFGIARAATQRNQTAVGCVKGKRGYMAPEQLQGFELDRRADIWSAGVVLWEALAGRRFITATDPMEAMEHTLAGSLPSLSECAPHVPEALAQIVGRAVVRDRTVRYQTALSFRRDLKAFAKDSQANADREFVAHFVGFHFSRFLGRHQREQKVDVDGQLNSAPPSPPPLPIPTAESEPPPYPLASSPLDPSPPPAEASGNAVERPALPPPPPVNGTRDVRPPPLPPGVAKAERRGSHLPPLVFEPPSSLEPSSSPVRVAAGRLHAFIPWAVVGDSSRITNVNATRLWVRSRFPFLALVVCLTGLAVGLTIASYQSWLALSPSFAIVGEAAMDSPRPRHLWPVRPLVRHDIDRAGNQVGSRGSAINSAPGAVEQAPSIAPSLEEPPPVAARSGPPEPVRPAETLRLPGRVPMNTLHSTEFP
jgi:serine/threonine-protein kinase